MGDIAKSQQQQTFAVLAEKFHFYTSQLLVGFHGKKKNVFMKDDLRRISRLIFSSWILTRYF